MKKIVVLSLVLAALFILDGSKAFAQCKSFTKKRCLPQLNPYFHNGQLNSATLMAGEKAELLMTFYSGQDYRLSVCAQPVFENVIFRVLDKNRKQIYSSENHNSNNWDFHMATTQQLFIEVSVPNSANKTKMIAEMVESGCVSVLVGFKQ
jgi:hypothetical protein